jgi:hypothetical protein
LPEVHGFRIRQTLPRGEASGAKIAHGRAHRRHMALRHGLTCIDKRKPAQRLVRAEGI